MPLSAGFGRDAEMMVHDKLPLRVREAGLHDFGGLEALRCKQSDHSSADVAAGGVCAGP